jgi:hypothetical protein
MDGHEMGREPLKTVHPQDLWLFKVKIGDPSGIRWMNG